MLPNLDQLWYVEAEGYIVIDLTDALVNGHDVLNWTRPTTNSWNPLRGASLAADFVDVVDDVIITCCRRPIKSVWYGQTNWNDCPT